MIRRLFEWGVVTESAGRVRQSPVGVTDQEGRAADRMAEALRAVPAGTWARGWVTALAYRPAWNRYDRLHTLLLAVRDASGTVEWITTGNGADGCAAGEPGAGGRSGSGR